jgi:hypothetical protein
LASSGITLLVLLLSGNQDPSLLPHQPHLVFPSGVVEVACGWATTWS